MVRIKRAYEAAADEDGIRLLVDQLWPRGVSKERAHIARWAKELAPSKSLRKWFSHDPAKWEEFRSRYRGELEDRKGALEEVAEKARHGTVTLVYGARDEEHNQAVVLKSVIEALGK